MNPLQATLRSAPSRIAEHNVWHMARMCGTYQGTPVEGWRGRSLGASCRRKGSCNGGLGQLGICLVVGLCGGGLRLQSLPHSKHCFVETFSFSLRSANDTAHVQSDNQ